MTTPPTPPTPPPGGYGYGAPIPPKHPKATTVLVFGILGLVCCQIFAPIAWLQGKNVHAEILASGGAYSGESEANIGKILGIIGTVLLGLYLIFLVFYVLLWVVILGAASSSGW